MKKTRLLAVLLVCCTLLSGCFFTKRPKRENETTQIEETQTERKDRRRSRTETNPSESEMNITDLDGINMNTQEIGQYIYNEPVELESTHIFSYKAGISFDTLYDYKKEEEYFSVYTNPTFTMYVEPEIDYDYSNQMITISPPRPDNVVVPSTDTDSITPYEDIEFAELFTSGEWGQIYTVFYLVQKVDMETGEALEKPIVSPFRIKRDIAPVEARYKITEQGHLHLAWEPVEGAQRYFIISVRSYYHPEDEQYTSGNIVRIMEQTTSTDWLSDDPDIHTSSMNYKIKQYQVSDDELQAEDDPDWIEQSIKFHETEYYYEFGVVADLGEKFSSYSPISGTELAESIPIQIAWKAAAETGFSNQGIAIDELPARCPVTVATGDTKLFTVRYDLDNALIWEGGGSIDFQVNGTNMAGMIIFSGLQGTEEEVVALEQKVASLYSEIQTPTGGEQTYTYIDNPPNLEDFEQTPETETPETPYQVNGSTEFVKFLAANMIQRNELIDYSAFSSSEIPQSIWDAVYEAEYQNPMILWIAGYNNYARDKVLYIEYEDAGTWEIKQNEIIASAQNIISQIITDGMSERDKTLSINNYLIDNCEYDYVALENMDLYGSQYIDPSHYDAWTPYGALVERTGVCASYSYSFKLLADLAGLNSIVVTGDTEGGRHAWNKVMIDGVWLNVDSTWNDYAPAPNEYFLLSDFDPGFADHSEDTYFMLDMYISEYRSAA